MTDVKAPRIEVSFVPTPLYVKAVGREKAMEQAEKCLQEEWMTRIRSQFHETIDEEDPISDAEEQAWVALQLAVICFLCGIITGVCVYKLVL